MAMAHALTWDVLGQVRTNHRNRRNRVQSVHVNFGAGGIMGQTFFLKADVFGGRSAEGLQYLIRSFDEAQTPVFDY